jgi:hypothetical protein
VVGDGVAGVGGDPDAGLPEHRGLLWGAWSVAHGWPDGDAARVAEEQEVIEEYVLGGYDPTVF